MNIDELGITMPAMEANPPLHCTVTKSYKYISLVFHAGSGDPVATFTIHQADIARLSAAIAEAVAAPTDSFDIRVYGRTTEGVARGGPPEQSDLVEFQSS